MLNRLSLSKANKANVKRRVYPTFTCLFQRYTVGVTT